MISLFSLLYLDTNWLKTTFYLYIILKPQFRFLQLSDEEFLLY